MAVLKVIWFILEKLTVIAFALAWSIWGLLGALPGGTVIRGSIAITLLYSSGFLHFISPYAGFDMTAVDATINGVGLYSIQSGANSLNGILT